MQPMYAGQPNSPQTELATSIDDTQDSFEVLNGDVLPDAPNLAVIGAGELAETIRYGQKVGNVLSEVERGFQGTAQSWQEGTKIARNFTAYDYDTLRGNVEELQDELDNLDLDAANVTLDSPDFKSTNVKDGMEELFTSVSNGKNEIATAITDMNQPASGTDTFPQLAQKIKDISSDATATAEDILSGQTAYARGVKLTGTRVRRTGHVNAQSILRTGTTLQLRPQAGDYDGSAGNSVQITHPTIDPSNIKAGVNFAGSGLIGTLTPATNYLYNAGLEPTPWVAGVGGGRKEWCYLYMFGNASSSNPANVSYVTDTTVNLSGVSKVKIRWRNGGMISNNNKSYLIVSTSKLGDIYTYDARLEKSSRFNLTEDELEVSSLNGSYFIRVHAWNVTPNENTNVEAVQIWLE